MPPGICTLTLNPTLDRHTTADEVAPDVKIRCSRPTLEPGGGGINVARVCRRFGVPAVAVFPAGGSAGQQLRALLKKDHIPVRGVDAGGETRTGLTVTARGRQYRFVLPGGPLDPTRVPALCDAFVGCFPRARYAVLSGSVPDNVDPSHLDQLAAAATAQGCTPVIDTSGPWLTRASTVPGVILKVNDAELAQVQRHLQVPEGRDEAAIRTTWPRLAAREWLVTLGPRGGWYAAAGRLWRFEGIDVAVRSTVGAGDSTVAGLLCAYVGGANPREALQRAVACGAAAATTPGTRLCDVETVEELRPRVVIHDAGELPQREAPQN